MSERGEGERGGEIDMQSSLVQSDEEEEERGEKEERQRYVIIDTIRSGLSALEGRLSNAHIPDKIDLVKELKSV